jgi:hypothetical protein
MRREAARAADDRAQTVLLAARQWIETGTSAACSLAVPRILPTSIAGALCLATSCAPPTPHEVVADAARQEDADMPAWKVLFDGTPNTAWRMSTIVNQPGHDDPGHFDIVDGALVARPGTDIGLLWHTEPTPADFELVLQWRQNAADDNSGVFVRFPDLDSKGYNNTAFVAAHFGYEVQIDNTGHPDGEPRHTTGAIYDMPDQQFSLVTPRAVGEWNEYRIRVVGDLYEVFLNGTQTTRFENHDAERGRGTFIGIQTHTGNVSFREIRLRRLLE